MRREGTPTPAPFNGTRFHTFSMRIHYDGGFSLAELSRLLESA